MKRMLRVVFLFLLVVMLACADTPLIQGYFAVSGYWKVEYQSLVTTLSWATLTNTQWTGMTNAQWVGMVN